MQPEQGIIIHCRDCAWFVPVDHFPVAEKLHEKLTTLFEDCLQKREGTCGVCRKVTFSEERPVLTNSEGFCHRAEHKQ